MSTTRSAAAAGGRREISANERFKDRARSWYWISLAVAAVVHYAVFSAGWLVVPDFTRAHRPLQAAMLITPEATALMPGTGERPEPPEPIARPAIPEVADAGTWVPDEVTIPVVDFTEYRLPEIPPPPVAEAAAEDYERFEAFVPTMVKPELLNPDEVRRELERLYPLPLQRAGIGGSALVRFWIDENGDVRHWEFATSTGQESLDRAIEKVVPKMRFRPALEYGEPIAVVVAVPITFVVP